MADDSSNLAETLEAELSQMTEEPEAPSGGAGGPGDAGEGGALKADDDDRNLDLIMDIPLRVTVELGRAKMVVSDLLNLGQGSVIELSKLAGEPMEVLVNDKLVARGEAVVVNEKFGVRLTDIISPTERVEQLK
ncbi:MAG: flagellar motor switch protein FliN [Bdellovibrionales bacterium]|nr:flagellar motor switch protein FliN [Bdellovibrionales bacterium]